MSGAVIHTQSSKPTARERSILCLAAQGYSNKETARHLGIGKRTVDNAWMAIREKYLASNRTQAVIRAMSMGDIPMTLRREGRDG